MIEANNSESIDKSKIPLRRIISLATGILIVAGIMIGSGIFKKIAPMAASGLSANYILAAWVVAGIITMMGAITVCGLATMNSESGGQYEYIRMAFGNLTGFLFGWSCFTIIGSASIAALAFIFSQSANTLIHIPEPLHALKNIAIGDFIYPFASSGIKLFAILSIIALTWINYLGTRNGAVLNNIFTLAKIFGVLMLILFGLSYSGPETITSTDQVLNTTPGSPLFLSAFFSAMLSAFWAYDGWVTVTFLSGEIKEPQRNLPIAIITGVIIVIILYLLVNYAYLEVLSVEKLKEVGQDKIAAAEMAGLVLGNAGSILIALLIMISTFGCLNAIIIAYPRLYYKMAKENSFFKNAANVHPLYRTPYVALIYSMIWSCILVISGTFDILTDMVIFAGFLFYALMAWGLIKMKRKGIITAKVIGYPFVPVIFILFSIVLIVNTVIVQPKQSVIGFVLLLSGLPVYYYFKRKYLIPAIKTGNK